MESTLSNDLYQLMYQTESVKQNIYANVLSCFLTGFYLFPSTQGVVDLLLV